MKYPFDAPASKVPYTGEIIIPDTPTFSGVVPIDNVPPTNQPPTASAGEDATITLPTNTVQLKGRGLDPEGAITSFLWTKVSGGAASIMSPTSANTDVTGLTTGNYSFRITVKDDKGAATSDEVSVTVKPAVVIPPVTPGKYEGFGSQATGGGSNIQHVTSENDFFSKLGSNRTLIFDNDVTIKKALYATNLSNVTIDGNGKNVTFDGINDDGISLEGSGCHHIILIGIRTINCTGDGMNATDGAHDIIFDHCSSYGNGDGNLDIAGGKFISIVSCFIGGGRSGWSGGSLLTGDSTSFFRNLVCTVTPGQVGERGPLVHASYSPVGKPNADIRNNLIWNWGRDGGTGSGFGIDVAYGATANVVNNYVYTKNSGSGFNNGITTSAYGEPTGKIFATGNVSGNSGVNANAKSNASEYPIADPYKITMKDAVTSAKDIVKNVGPAIKTKYESDIINSIVIP